jgi:MoaA/NifB/PqqE/SkfB family radical SAM enzyme
MDTVTTLEVIELLARGGTRVIVISGGEPTLLTDLPVILSAIKAKGIRSVLSTNGLLLARTMDQVLPMIDWLALPIESADHTLNSRLRTSPPNYFSYIRDLILTVRQRYPDVRIKLGTVVTRVNRTSVASIPTALGKEALPDVWKLYEFSATNYGYDNQLLLTPSVTEFRSTVQAARRIAEEHCLPLVVYSNAERDGKYLFVDPTGQALVIAAGDEVPIGSIVNEPQLVADTWPKYVDERRLEANVLSTYPLT